MKFSIVYECACDIPEIERRSGEDGEILLRGTSTARFQGGISAVVKKVAPPIILILSIVKIVNRKEFGYGNLSKSRFAFHLDSCNFAVFGVSDQSHIEIFLRFAIPAVTIRRMTLIDSFDSK
jgi:hypothetical protein